MADLRSRITAEISDFEGAFNRLKHGVQQATGEMERHTRTADSGFQRLVTTIERHEQGLRRAGLALAGFGASVGAGIGVATSQFMSFEQGIARAVGAAGGGADDFREFSDVAKQMATELGRGGVTARGAADALFFIASAGFKGKEAIAALQPSLVLAAATQSDLGSITSSVIATLNQFGLTTADTSRVTNAFAAVNQLSLASMEKLTLAMVHAGPAMATAGKSVEEASAALGILFNAGLRAESAGVGLRNIIVRLLDPTKEVTEGLQQFGVKVSEINPLTRSLAEIVDVFNKKQVDAATIVKVFGQEAFISFEALRRTGGAALLEMERKLTGTNSAMQQFQVQADTGGAAVTNLTSQVSLASIEMGERFLQRMQPVIGFLTTLVESWRALPAPIKDVTATVGVGLAGTATLTGAFLLFLSMVPRIVAGVRLLVATFMSLLPLLATPQGLLIIGLGVLAAGVAVVATKFASAEESGTRFGTMIGALKERMKVITSEDRKAIDALAASMQKLNEPAKPGGRRPLEGLDEDAKKLAAAIQQDLTKQVQAFDDAMRKLDLEMPNATNLMTRQEEQAVALAKSIGEEGAKAYGVFEEALRKADLELMDGTVLMTRQEEQAKKLKRAIQDEGARAYLQFEDAMRAADLEMGRQPELVHRVVDSQRALRLQQQLVTAGYTTQQATALAAWREQAEAQQRFFSSFRAGVIDFLASGRSMWETFRGLTVETLQNASRSLSDVFFAKFQGETISAMDLWESFMTSMKRTIANFLADAVVRQFLDFFLGVFGLGTGGGGGFGISFGRGGGGAGSTATGVAAQTLGGAAGSAAGKVLGTDKLVSSGISAITKLLGFGGTSAVMGAELSGASLAAMETAIFEQALASGVPITAESARTSALAILAAQEAGAGGAAGALAGLTAAESGTFIAGTTAAGVGVGAGAGVGAASMAEFFGLSPMAGGLVAGGAMTAAMLLADLTGVAPGILHNLIFGPEKESAQSRFENEVKGSQVTFGGAMRKAQSLSDIAGAFNVIAGRSYTGADFLLPSTIQRELQGSLFGDLGGSFANINKGNFFNALLRAGIPEEALRAISPNATDLAADFRRTGITRHVEGIHPEQLFNVLGPGTYTLPGGEVRTITPGGEVIDPYANFMPVISGQHGFHGMVTKPTMFVTGEAGAERVDVTPLSQPSGSELVININVTGGGESPEARARRIARAIRDELRRLDERTYSVAGARRA